MLTLFRACCAPVIVGMGAVVWQRQGLPQPGSVAQQDARTMAAIDFLLGVHNRMEVDARATARRTRREETHGDE